MDTLQVSVEQNPSSDREEPTPPIIIHSSNSAPPSTSNFDLNSQLPNLNSFNKLQFPLYKPNPILATSDFFIPQQPQFPKPKSENGAPENSFFNNFIQFAEIIKAFQQQNQFSTLIQQQLISDQQLTENEILKIESLVENGEMKEEENDVKDEMEAELDNQELPRQIRGPRRQYSEMELNVAIHQIKSGQMGTRRASATYGIPRSTLRNKMNKNIVPYDLNRPIQNPLLNSKQSSEENDQIACQIETPVIQNKPELPSPDEYHQQMQQSQQNWTQLLKTSNFQFPADISSFFHSITQNHLNNLLLNNQKPARGKRGQYRRYEKAQLQSAVEAVRGGMSVHRAGTLFGVPHSTLEYKVKDRSRKGQQLRLEAQLKKEQEMEVLKQEMNTQSFPETLSINVDEPSTSKIEE